MRFSIVMPVFNAGKHLIPAINSITKQTFGDFELLLVDDGSTDGSSMVCEEAALLDKRIRVFHRANAGISKSRNFGIDNAQGDLITFCDHDDIYLPEFLSVISETITATTDVIKVNYEVFNRDEDGKTDIDRPGSSGADSEWSVNGSYNLLVLMTSMAWDGAYRRSFLNSHNLRFDETFKYGGEDADFSLRCLSKARNAKWLSTVCYRHFTNYGKSTSSKFHQNLIADYLRVANTEQQLFSSIVASDPIAHFRRWLAGLQNFIFNAHDNPLSMHQMAHIYADYMEKILGANTARNNRYSTIGDKILLFLVRNRLSLAYGYSKALLFKLHKWQH